MTSSRTPRVLILAVNHDGWLSSIEYDFQQAIVESLPGSVAYGPGYLYNTNYVPDIVREVFGSDPPDLVVSFARKQELIGQPISEVQRSRYNVPPELAVFPVGLRDVSVPKCLHISDFWHCTQNQWDETLLGNGFRYAMSVCCPPFGSRAVFDKFFSAKVQEAVRFVPWPHAVNPLRFKNFGIPKQYDVTLLGSLFDELYPLRRRMHAGFAKVGDIEFFTTAHPGYTFVGQGGQMAGETYARTLNQTRLFATCSTVWGIPLKKMYEAMACKSVPLCDRPYGAEHLGFVDREHYLAVTDTNFVDTARHFLAYPAELDRISRNGHDLVHTRHTIAVRGREFRDTFTALLGGQEPDGWASLFSDARRLDRTWSDPRDAITAHWRTRRDVAARRVLNAIRHNTIAPACEIGGHIKRMMGLPTRHQRQQNNG